MVVIDSKEVYAEHFNIRGLIGRGGIGRVFLGFDKDIEREVAIKEMAIDPKSADHKLMLARFVREAKITGRLEHPGIVPVYEMGVKDDGHTYYVMRYVRGRTFYKAMEECRKRTEEASFTARMRLLDSLIDVADAVGYAHANEIIHRDLKPGNIILGEFGETILIDWGIAKKISGDHGEKDSSFDLKGLKEPLSEEKTKYGSILGTISYMAPEQADARWGAVDRRSDVYSLGSILFMLLTGRKPYEGERDDVLDCLTSDRPAPSPRDIADYVPPELAAICEKAMAKRQEDRFSDASELAKELKAYRDGRLVSVYAYSRTELLRRFVSRNRVAVMAALAVMAAVLAGGGLALHYAIDAHRARVQAEKALSDVTALSQTGGELTETMVRELENYLDTLSAGMESAAKGLERVDLANEAAVTPILTALHRKYPGIVMFETIAAPGRVTAVAPDDFKSSVGLDVSDQEIIKKAFSEKKKNFTDIFRTKEGFYAVALQLPVFKGGKFAGMLSALIDTGRFIPSVLSVNPLESAYNVWCLEEDGRVLYDEDPTEIGKLLFRGDIYDEYPELYQFGKKMLADEWGYGTYKFTDISGKKIIHKIAAWDTFTPIEGVLWKVVVSYPYVVGK